MSFDRSQSEICQCVVGRSDQVGRGVYERSVKIEDDSQVLHDAL